MPGASGDTGLAIVVQWLHFVAAGAWLGGLVALLLTMVGTQPDGGTRLAVGRFARVATVGLGLVAATGVLRAIAEVGSADALVSTDFGRLVIASPACSSRSRAWVLSTTSGTSRVPGLSAGPSADRARPRWPSGWSCWPSPLHSWSFAPPSSLAGAVAAAPGPQPAPSAAVVTGHDFGTSTRVVLSVTPDTAGVDVYARRPRLRHRGTDQRGDRHAPVLPAGPAGHRRLTAGPAVRRQQAIPGDRRQHVPGRRLGRDRDHHARRHLGRGAPGAVDGHPRPAGRASGRPVACQPSTPSTSRPGARSRSMPTRAHRAPTSCTRRSSTPRAPRCRSRRPPSASNRLMTRRHLRTRCSSPGCSSRVISSPTRTSPMATPPPHHEHRPRWRLPRRTHRPDHDPSGGMNDPGQPSPTRVISALVLAIAGIILGACNGSTAVPVSPSADAVSPSVATTPAFAAHDPAVTPMPRPSSPARLRVTSPNGAEVHGGTAHIALDLRHATITSATSTDIRPDVGHVHLYVDNVLVSMNYGLEQDLPVRPGLTWSGPSSSPPTTHPSRHGSGPTKSRSR